MILPAAERCEQTGCDEAWRFTVINRADPERRIRLCARHMRPDYTEPRVPARSR